MEVRKVSVSVLGGADVAFAMRGAIVQVTWHGRVEALLVGCPRSAEEAELLCKELAALVKTNVSGEAKP